MSWSLLQKLVSEVENHSSLFGKYWFSFLFVFRVIIVINVGEQVKSFFLSFFNLVLCKKRLNRFIYIHINVNEILK